MKKQWSFISRIAIICMAFLLVALNAVTLVSCSKSEKTCKSAPAWVYSKGYWTTSADYDSLVWCVSLDGYFVSDVFDGLYGLRPVITISKSDI